MKTFKKSLELFAHFFLKSAKLMKSLLYIKGNDV